MNCVTPPIPPKTVAPLLVKEVMLPAVALLLNNISPLLPAPSTAVTKFCVIPELLVMPVPLRVNVTVGLTVIVKECVSKAVNVIAAIEFAGVTETKREVTVDKSRNVAVFPAVVPGYPPPAGSVNQLPLVFQSVEPSEIHDASSAKVALCIESKSKVAVARSNDVCDFLKKLNLVFMLILHWPTAPKTCWRWMLGKVQARSQA